MGGFFDKIINLIFPKEISVVELENLSPEGLAKLLPPPPSGGGGADALFSYKDRRVKTLVNEIKHHENKILAEKATELMCEKILEIFEDDLQFGTRKFALVPVPSSSNRKNERGYNPAELIAQKIVAARPDIFTFAPILKKIRETKRQINLSRKERLTNLVGVFKAEPFDISKGSAIVIDDVSTTGATIAEAKRALEKEKIFVQGTCVIAK